MSRVWPETTIGAEFQVQLGKRFDEAVNRGVPKPCLTNRGVRWGRILASEIEIAPLTPQDIRDLRLRSGDVLVCEGGEIGRASVWLDELIECYYANTLHRLRPRNGYHPHLMVAVLEQMHLSGQLSATVGKSSIAHLTKENILRLVIPLPSTQEQYRIATALSDADDLIAALERLIAKKRAIKQGMMQELLIGRTRLPGFDETWHMTKLEDLGKFLKGRGITRDEVRTSGVACIRYGEIYTTYRDYTLATSSFVDSQVAATALPIAAGDILFAGSGETKEEIGTCVAYVGEIPAVAGGDIIVLRGSGYDAVFLGSLLNTPTLAAVKARSGQGDAVVHINSRALAALPVELPSLPEQRAIADVLREADAEIDALERRLAVTRNIKQGMMQELLTGRTRLPVEEVAQ